MEKNIGKDDQDKGVIGWLELENHTKKGLCSRLVLHSRCTGIFSSRPVRKSSFNHFIKILGRGGGINFG